MIYLIEQSRLFTTFNINSFDNLENSISSMAPSMSEYYLNDLISSCESNSYLNKSNIQNTIYTDLFNIYLDYDLNIYFELLKSEDELIAESLW